MSMMLDSVKHVISEYMKFCMIFIDPLCAITSLIWFNIGEDKGLLEHQVIISTNVNVLSIRPPDTYYPGNVFEI